MTHGTVALRAYHVGRFAIEHHDIDPYAVTLDDLSSWFAAHRDWRPEYRRSIRSSLRVFYGWAFATRRIDFDPTMLLRRPHVPPALPRPTPEYVIRRVLRAGDDRTKLMVLLGATCMMRRGEISRLHTDWIEGDNLRIPGKGGRVRLVPLPSNVAAMLDLVPRGYVFPRPGTDEPMTPAHVGKLISRALGPGYTAHTLRHRGATKAYAVDRDLIAVQELLGHAKIETTRIYTQAPDGAKRRAAAGAEITAA